MPTTSPPAATTPRSDVAGGEVTLAAVIGAHGIGGEVRLKLFTDDPANLRAHGSFVADGRTLTLQSIRPGPNGAVARFAEIADRTAAEGMRGVALKVPRAALPPLEPGEYYHADLIGLTCLTTAGDALGTVVAIENFGAGDVIEIERQDGKRFMVPMNAQAVPEWDAERLLIEPGFIV